MMRQNENQMASLADSLDEMSDTPDAWDIDRQLKERADEYYLTTAAKSNNFGLN